MTTDDDDDERLRPSLPITRINWFGPNFSFSFANENEKNRSIVCENRKHTQNWIHFWPSYTD